MEDAISCSNVRTIFLRHELFWFCVVPVCTIKFFFFLISHCSDGEYDGSEVRISLVLGASSNHGSHRSFDVHFKELGGCCYHSGLGSQSPTNKSSPCVRTWVLTLPELPVSSRTSLPSCAKVALFAAMEQKVSSLAENVSSLTARIFQIKANATPVPDGYGSARSWNLLGHSCGSIAAGPLGSPGPGSSDNRNTRRGLDTFSSPEDAVLPRANNTTVVFPRGL